MHLRFWVYRGNLSSNPESPFRSNGDFLRKAGCCISGFIGLLFLALALLCFFSPQADKDGKLFLIFAVLFAIFEGICLMYSCIPCFQKYCKRSENEEGDEYSSSRSSLLSSDGSAYQEVPGNQGIASYQTSFGYPEAPDYPGIPNYQAGPSYQELPNYPVPPYGAEGGIPPGIVTNFRPLANYEDVFVHQKTPIYQQDLMEPQLPPYSHGNRYKINIPKCDIHVY